MAEESVWRGTSSQWINCGRYILSALIFMAIIVIWAVVRHSASPQWQALGPYLLFLLLGPIIIALSRYLKTKNKVYELTTERLKTSEGVFGKVTDTLELYRVKDLETRQPFFYRIVGVENVQLNTSDTSTPFILIDAIPCAVGLADKIRNQVEAIRQQKGVRELDIE